VTGPPEPRLYVVARPALDFEAVTAFLRDEETTWRRTPGVSASEELVEVAGRVCYMSFGERQSPRTNAEYLARLVGQGHHSVLEHASWTFLLTGVTRAFTHQLVRHRIGFSYSQLSQQYHDERTTDAVMPEALRARPQLAEIWQQAVDGAQQAYRDLLDALAGENLALSDRESLRLVRSAARTVLPAATGTKIAFTANARALRHFLVERGSLSGDEEMRRVCVLILDAVHSDAPGLFSDLTTTEGPAGIEVVPSQR
jgi:thymidylate synthase (FAD)